MNTTEFDYLNKKVLYFDNGATTFKPISVIESTVDYYTNYSTSVHRGDYDLSLKADLAYENARELVKHFINAKSKEEIIFNSGTTEGINQIAEGFFKNILNERDEIILTQTEHASNILPWYRLSEELGLTIKFIPLTDNYEVTIANLKKVITAKTKVVSIAHITNVIGDTRPVKEISEYLHDLGIYLVIDAAQSAPRLKIDVKELDADFLVFSAHKMYGPTGVGVLYGRRPYLEKMKPLILGGGMNDDFREDGTFTYKPVPYKFEAGTPNIAGVIAFTKALELLIKLGMHGIEGYERELRAYTLEKLRTLKHIEIYNKEVSGATIIFNVKGVFAQDTAIYLNQFGICVRAGSHCAKLIPSIIGVANTCRITFGIYNTKTQIDYLVKALAAAADDVYKGVV